MFKKLKIGLALGSGGARGLAHIGVLKVLEREKIPIHVITGSNIGAVVGGMYAQQPDIRKVENKIQVFFSGEDFKKTGLQLFKQEIQPENFFGQIARRSDDGLSIQWDKKRVSLMKQNRLGMIIEHLLGDRLIENTRIKFAPVATNLETGEIVVFRSGSMREAVKASASIPGFLPPMQYRDMVLVDGAVSASIPVEPAFSLGADFVIAVNVGRSLEHEIMPSNVIDILFRTNLITSLRNDIMACEKANVVIKPDVGHIHWADFEKLSELIAAGEKYTETAVEIIKMGIRKNSGRFVKYEFEKTEAK
ncbi:patatin-like phospholipase family protein [bacterium]|nr:patatin-like phospholipase family protein [bacterium]